jgi:hypothetical protein
MLLRAVRRVPLVVSFPKAGRTWLRVMLDQLGIAAEYTHFGAGVARALPAEELAPNPWWCARRPTLLLLRDPRDTLVSSYYQAVKRRRVYDGPLAEFVRDPRFGIEKVARWNLAWAQLARESAHVAMIAYEQLGGDGPALLGAVARHFGAPRADEALRAAWEHASFDAMRAREVSGEIEQRYRKALGARTQGDEGSLKVRRGVIGGYRDELSEADVAYCDDALARTDYAAEIRKALAERGLRA